MPSTAEVPMLFITKKMCKVDSRGQDVRIAAEKILDPIGPARMVLAPSTT